MAQFQPRRWHREQEALARAQAAPAIPDSVSAQTQPPAPQPLANDSMNPGPAPTADLHPNEKKIILEIEPPSFPSLPPPSRVRTGKIARLPEAIRTEVNHLLRHAVPYPDIVKHLEELGYPGISINNIYNWRHGGFVEWYRNMQAREAALIPLKGLERCSRAVDIDRWQQNAILSAAEKFANIMSGISNQRAIEAVYEKPELLPKYVAAMRDLSRCAADLAKAYGVVQQQEITLRHDLKLQELPLPPEPDEQEPTESHNTPPTGTPPQAGTESNTAGCNPNGTSLPVNPAPSTPNVAGRPSDHPGKSSQIQPSSPPSSSGPAGTLKVIP